MKLKRRNLWQQRKSPKKEKKSKKWVHKWTVRVCITERERERERDWQRERKCVFVCWTKKLLIFSCWALKVFYHRLEWWWYGQNSFNWRLFGTFSAHSIFRSLQVKKWLKSEMEKNSNTANQHQLVLRLK